MLTSARVRTADRPSDHADDDVSRYAQHNTEDQSRRDLRHEEIFTLHHRSAVST